MIGAKRQKVQIHDLPFGDSLLLPRIDTNDLPKQFARANDDDASGCIAVS